MRIFPILFSVFLLSVFLSSCKNSALQKTNQPRLEDIRLPEGFEISIYADNVTNARSLALGTNGTVFVGNRKGDKVFALQDLDGDGKAEKKYILAEGMNMPNGVAFKDGALYIAEVDKIWKFENIESHLDHPPKPKLVFDQLPDDKHHGWKFIAFGPDDKLYIPIGAPCNNCESEDKRYASICRMNDDGTDFEVFAHGIRNTVGFDWHPETAELYFTENGRDQMGNDIPPDELNKAPQIGMNFGYPYCHAGTIPDPEFGQKHSCSQFTSPLLPLAPHTAALGMRFYTGNLFPESYKNKILIAEHGSWNRDEPIGYRVMMVSENGSQYKYEEFATGWLKNGKAWGRPVDILQLEDGSILVSDDFANLVYRISYKN